MAITTAEFRRIVAELRATEAAVFSLNGERLDTLLHLRGDRGTPERRAQAEAEMKEIVGRAIHLKSHLTAAMYKKTVGGREVTFFALTRLLKEGDNVCQVAVAIVLAADRTEASPQMIRFRQLLRDSYIKVAAGQ